MGVGDIRSVQGIWTRIRMDPYSFLILDPAVDTQFECISGFRGNKKDENPKKSKEKHYLIYNFYHFFAALPEPVGAGFFGWSRI